MNKIAYDTEDKVLYLLGLKNTINLYIKYILINI